MIQLCPRCGKECSGKQEVAYHLLGEERCYTSGVEILPYVRAKITTVEGQVEFILHRFPGARGDPTMLENWHKVFIQHTHYYDTMDHSFHEKHGLPLKFAPYVTKGGTIDRLRRKVQRDDGLIYHETARGEKNQVLILERWRVDHHCIRASTKVELMRAVEAQESRKLYASMSGASMG